MLKYRYNSLEDYLQSHPLDVDGLLDDGFGAPFPVKGRVIDAAVLFADMTAFSTRSKDLSPIETLIFANNFFAWISAEGLLGKPGIVDKYIGDEVMVVFAQEFGSEDAFVDAVEAARWMAERDYLGFCPHLGIAAGPVVVGYVGTPLKYICSVYGRPVTLARRCCQVSPLGHGSRSIIVPANLWEGRDLHAVLKKREVQRPDGQTFQIELPWELMPMRKETLRNGEEVEVVEIALQTMCLPPMSAEDRAKEGFEGLQHEGSYRPRRYPFERVPSCFKKEAGNERMEQK
jgi:class 3 adenylate cyclase